MMRRLASRLDASMKRPKAEKGVLLKLRRFIEDRRGIGAIEFAIIAPLLVMAYVGAFEISVGVSASRKVNRASAMVSELLTRDSNTNKATLDTMKDLTAKIVAPFPTNVDGYSLKITGIAVAADGKATVAWSRDDKAGKPYPVGTVISLPASLGAKSTFVVRTELVVPHTVLLMMPGLSSSSLNKIPLNKTSYFSLRRGDKITCSDC